MSPASTASGAAAFAMLLLLALRLPSLQPGADAIPVEPNYGLLIEIPWSLIREVPLGPDGKPLLYQAEMEEAPGTGRALKSRAHATAYSFGPPVVTSHHVSKKVRSKSSYQATGMAAPSVTGCEAICALQKNGGGS